MTRGEIWFAEVGRKRRPVLVLTRPEVIDVRALVTVAEVTTSMRNIAAEVDFDYERPLRSESVRTGCQPAGTSPGDQDSRQGRARKARKVSLNGFGA